MLEDLQFNKTYFYSINDETEGRSWKHSNKTGSFRTPPKDNESSTFRFVVFSDFRDFAVGNQGFKDVVDNDWGFGNPKIIEKPVFFFQIGDWSHRNPGLNNSRIENWQKMHRDVMHNNLSGMDFDRFIAPNMLVSHIGTIMIFHPIMPDQDTPQKIMQLKRIYNISLYQIEGISY